MKKILVLTLALAMGVVAPRLAGAMTGGKKVFDQSNNRGHVQVFTKYNGSFRYMVEDGLLRAWTDDGASRRAHLSLILAPSAKKALVVGPGAGAAVEAALFHGVESVDVVMNNPLVLNASRLVAEKYANALSDSRVKIIYADPAKWLDNPKGQYDQVFLWSSVFKPEEMGRHLSYDSLLKAKKLLNPGGAVTLWIPMGLYDGDQFKSALAAFSRVFPAVSLWAPEMTPDLGWALLIGSESGMRVDLARTKEQLTRMMDSYRFIERDNVASFLSFYVSSEEELKEALLKGKIAIKPLSGAKLPDWKSGGNISRENYRFMIRLRTPISSRTNANEEEAKRLDDYFTARTRMIEGRLVHKTQEGGKEIGFYDEALKSAPDDPHLGQLYQMLGKAYFLSNLPKKAAHLLEKAKAINPNHAATRYYLGKSYEAMTRYEKASPEYQKLKELEPNFMETLSVIGMELDE